MFKSPFEGLFGLLRGLLRGLSGVMYIITLIYHVHEYCNVVVVVVDI